ncbi:hypothetical protein COX69_02075 [Candidatus Falkowbacteria bacterium CG_4_10_14_0_2_um_filter_48_10]|uniref:Uncharacterized protein n=1 Tax=Candidatus Falkowbacteria bacterium CG23_combo_of_CG06-09_8_20_14_all_49_15 TaxID=1974572 RepID=A0A2G9ZJJ1_9BACT|nr:MAG: hypothetical protein COX22_04965 [Candidatus Falkowbacteria bacterium CG23_combo_of_CG06-09_8_20_14_all_49_15]PJA08539.1 MAG: hypothetical protein COX69_02075 [Candidatus Falkowbacteria bacterium CG_4_10_14_0_2_um_filter_48_10]
MFRTCEQFSTVRFKKNFSLSQKDFFLIFLSAEKKFFPDSAAGKKKSRVGRHLTDRGLSQNNIYLPEYRNRILINH